jgi:hypothetical protein
LRSKTGVVLVVLPVLAILLAASTIAMTRTSGQMRPDTALQSDARATMNTLASQVRRAFAGNGRTRVLAATATSITFQSPGKRASSHLRRISYSITAGTLRRQRMTSRNTLSAASMSPWSPIVGSITNTDVFTYYTDAGAQATPPAPLAFPIADTAGIRVVGMKFTLSIGGSRPETFTVFQTVDLRSPDG